MKRISPDELPTDATPIQDPEFTLRYTTLLEFLTLDQYDDGKPRVRGSMTVFCNEGQFKGCLNDKDSATSLFYSADGFEGLLEGLNRKLLNSSPKEWRRWKRKK